MVFIILNRLADLVIMFSVDVVYHCWKNMKSRGEMRKDFTSFIWRDEVRRKKMEMSV